MSLSLATLRSPDKGMPHLCLEEVRERSMLPCLATASRELACALWLRKVTASWRMKWVEFGSDKGRPPCAFTPERSHVKLSKRPVRRNISLVEGCLTRRMWLDCDQRKRLARRIIRRAVPSPARSVHAREGQKRSALLRLSDRHVLAAPQKRHGLQREKVRTPPSAYQIVL